MHSSKIITAIAALICTTLAYAEPPLQAGDTLDSLSQVRITTTLQAPINAEELALIAQLDSAEDTVTEQQNLKAEPISSQVNEEQLIDALDQPEVAS